MKKLLKMSTLIAILLFVFANSAHAKVTTVDHISERAKKIYVIGNENRFPMEYYDKRAKEYRGTIPDILNIISKETGIDFAYVHHKGIGVDAIGENLQVDMISFCNLNDDVPCAVDSTKIFTQGKKGKTMDYGMVFTSYAGDKEIASIKNAMSEISDETIHNIILEQERMFSRRGYIYRTIALSICVILFLAYLIHLILKMKQMAKITDLLDTETGIGNLLHFKRQFGTILNASRSMYYVVYFVLDSNYAKRNIRDEKFEDIVKFTAELLIENVNNIEIAARITENGFAYAFQADNDNEALQQTNEIIKSVNKYLDIEDEELSIIYGALHKLESNERDADVLLFNLRRNCNKLIGTPQNLVLCDKALMDKAYEDKKFYSSAKHALENGEFKTYLQYIMDNRTKKIAHAEALSRWEHPEKGMIDPGKYIERMGQNGLIDSLDCYMFERVCEILESWSVTDKKDICISCNFTRITISKEDFAKRIKKIADKYLFDKRKLVIEITEDAIENNVERAIYNINECKKLGFRVALDDVGSGYTSLINLCEYPIDIVKIDRSVLLKTDQEKGKELYKGIIELAHRLGLSVVCEGVENETQNRFVSDSACDYIQGYYYCTPTEVVLDRKKTKLKK